MLNEACISFARKYLPYVSVGICGFIVLLSYRAYFSEDVILSRDDNYLIGPLLNISNIRSYVQAVISNQILDVQPMRDLVFMVNIFFKKKIPILGFHLVNILIFYLLVVLLYKLLTTLTFSSGVSFWVLGMFLVHPIMLSAVGWISARKHSLALFFLLCSILRFLNKKEIDWMVGFWFVLSLLSHQIFFLYPAWLLVFAKAKDWKIKWWVFSAIVFISLVIVGLASYKTFLINVNEVYYTDGDKFLDNFSRYILSIGRTFSLLIFPVKISVIYDQGSFLNIFGIMLLPVVLMIFYKSSERKNIFLWLFLASLAHIPTYIAFVNDTYLYLTLICFLVAITYYLKSLELVLKFRHMVVIFCIMLSLAYKTVTSSVMWTSDFNLWEYSFQQEPNPKVGISYSGFLFPKDRLRSIEILSWSAKNFNFRGHRPQEVLFYTLIHLSGLPVKEKVRILEESKIQTDLYKLSLGFIQLKGDENDVAKGISNINFVLKKGRRYKPASEEFQIIKGIKEMCTKGSAPGWFCKELDLNSVIDEPRS